MIKQQQQRRLQQRATAVPDTSTTRSLFLSSQAQDLGQGLCGRQVAIREGARNAVRRASGNKCHTHTHTHTAQEAGKFRAAKQPAIRRVGPYGDREEH